MASLAIAAGAVGIASFGIQVCQGLLSYYDDWKDYKSDIGSAYNAITDLCRTLVLLKTSLNDGHLDVERTQRVKDCMHSCEGALIKLSEKNQKLQKYGQPEGRRQKALAEVQRMFYPFQASTLAKLLERVSDIQERLKLALDVLQLDASIAIQTSVTQVLTQQQQLLAVQESGQFRKIVAWLAPPDPWTNHASARERHEAQTGGWLLQSDQYQNWKTGSTRHIWMYGKAGCGKTVLCSEAVEDTRAHTRTTVNTALAVFYFSFSDDQKQSYEKLVRSLVCQLGWKEPALSMLRQAYEGSSQSVPGIEELDKILHTAIQAHDSVFLVLDALDECPENADVRRTLLERVTGLARRASSLKILATSRELSDIRESMEILGAQQIAIAKRAVDADIRRYVSSELSGDPRLRRLNPKSKIAIEQTISQKADGMFRWAYCQLQELKKLKSTKPKYITETLHNLPKDLDATYERILTGIDPMYHTDALTLLRWLVYARSPPSLGELAEATIIDPLIENSVDTDNRGGLEDTLNILSGLVIHAPSGSGNEDDSDDEDDDDDEDDGGDEDNSDASPHKSDVDNVVNDAADDKPLSTRTKIRLAHFSVQEYLLSSRILDGNAKGFHLEHAKEHRFLTQSCVAYIMHYSSSSEKTSTKKDLVTFPLLLYAAKSWIYHSSLQQHGDTDHEVRLLTSDRAKRDWLLIDRLDQQPWHVPFEKLDRNICTGLYYASLASLGAVVSLLLEKGADVNAQGGWHDNALQAAIACKPSDLEIVELLLQKGADVNAQGGEEYGNALQAALDNGRTEIADLLLEHGAIRAPEQPNVLS